LVERNFVPVAPNRLWAADIKYVRTWQGWLYLAAVMDCYSRRIVGWSMRPDLESELVVDALEMAIARRRPPAGLVHHSDQGSQYVSLRFGERCREIGIHRSMGSRGDCFDNAVAESFFATLEKDLLRRRSFATRQEAVKRSRKVHQFAQSKSAPPGSRVISAGQAEPRSGGA
jgi:putative transposase